MVGVDQLVQPAGDAKVVALGPSSHPQAPSDGGNVLALGVIFVEEKIIIVFLLEQYQRGNPDFRAPGIFLDNKENQEQKKEQTAKSAQSSWRR